MVLIKVKTLTHKIHEINVNIGDKFSQVKEQISNVIDQKLIDHEYKIIHLGKIVNDDDEITQDHDQKLFILMCTKKKVEIKTSPPLGPTGTSVGPNTISFAPPLGQNGPASPFTINIPTITSAVNMSQINPSSSALVTNLLSHLGLSYSSIDVHNPSLLMQTLNSIPSLNNINNNAQINPPSQMSMNNLDNTGNVSLAQMNNLNNLINQFSNIIGNHPELDEDEDEDEGEGAIDEGIINEADIAANEDAEHNGDHEDDDDGSEDTPTPPLNMIDASGSTITNTASNSSNQNYNIQMVGQFTMKEVDDINEIVNMGFDYYEVIQIYNACGKNKDDAVALLLGN